MYVIQKSAFYHPSLRDPVISYFKDCIFGIEYYTENIDDALKFSSKEAAIWCRLDYIKRRKGERIEYKEIPNPNMKGEQKPCIWGNSQEEQNT